MHSFVTSGTLPYCCWRRQSLSICCLPRTLGPSDQVRTYLEMVNAGFSREVRRNADKLLHRHLRQLVVVHDRAAVGAAAADDVAGGRLGEVRAVEAVGE